MALNFNKRGLAHQQNLNFTLNKPGLKLKCGVNPQQTGLGPSTSFEFPSTNGDWIIQCNDCNQWLMKLGGSSMEKRMIGHCYHSTLHLSGGNTLNPGPLGESWRWVDWVPPNLQSNMVHLSSRFGGLSSNIYHQLPRDHGGLNPKRGYQLSTQGFNGKGMQQRRGLKPLGTLGLNQWFRTWSWFQIDISWYFLWPPTGVKVGPFKIGFTVAVLYFSLI